MRLVLLLLLLLTMMLLVMMMVVVVSTKMLLRVVRRTTVQIAAALAGVGWAVARCTGPGPGALWAAGRCLLLPGPRGLPWVHQGGCLCGHTGAATGCVRAARS